MGPVLAGRGDQPPGPRSSGAISARRPNAAGSTRVGRPGILGFTSNPALPNFTLTKLLWVRQHEPDTWRRVRHVMLPKDYVRFGLTGEHAIDMADASGT